VDKGFVGSVEEWLASLEGKRGEKGATGDRGLQGERGEKGETGEVGAQGDPGADGEDGADGRDFEVPTLAAAPGENTLTYGQPATPFRVGQLARVWDAGKGEAGEWVFHQLFDLTDGRALWKLSGSGELPGETLIITLETNQPDAAQHLLGVEVRVIHRDGEVTLTWQGEPLATEVPFSADCRVECRDVELFTAPEAAEFFSIIGFTRRLTFTYLAESVTVTASISDGEADASQAVVTITDETTATVRYNGPVGPGVQLFVPYGHRYRVSAARIVLYVTPDEFSAVAEATSRDILLSYRRIPTTRIVFDKTIADPANITGAGTGVIVDILAKMRRCLCKKTAEGEVAICYLHNSNSTVYADMSSAVLTGGEGDVMVYKPPFYYKHELVDANRFAYTLAEYDLDGTCIYSPASLIGAYKSNQVGDKLFSWSGVYPGVRQSQTGSIASAKARGGGYNLIDYEQHCMIALLLYAKYGTRDSQAVLGTGGASVYYESGTLNGTTNSRGNADTSGATSDYTSFAGIEGVYGCVFEFMSGVAVTATLSDDGNYISAEWEITNLDGTTRRVSTLTTGRFGGWIKDIAVATGPWFDMTPTEVGGSETTHYADQYQISAGSTPRAVRRSSNGANRYGGVSCISADFDSSTTNAAFASRLAFRGVIREAESVAAFKALPVL
jgi:hypothetical protein